MAYEVPLEKLRKVCREQDLGFEATDQVQPLVGILGQERALRALRFGLATRREGFHIYVAGPPGTGRTTAVMAFLEQVAKDKPVPPDWCYVNNFRDPYYPRAIRLPAGRARQFRADMEALLAEVRERMPRLFEDERYSQRRDSASEAFQQQRQTILARLGQAAQQAGFLMETSPTGLELVPLKDGRPMREEEFTALAEGQRNEIAARRARIEAEVNASMKQVRRAEKMMQERLQEVDRDIALVAVRPAIEELKEKYAASADVLTYLSDVQADILANLAAFQTTDQPAASAEEGERSLEYDSRRCAVNVMVDNGGLQGLPVVTELNPTFESLFGRIEREAEYGTLVTDFTMLKSGALQRANGGYLVVPAESLLNASPTWNALKRALRSRTVGIEDATERTGGVPVKSVRPEPIPLDVKVILIGSVDSYFWLYDEDPDFSELFKVKADFDVRMERSPENVRAFIGFLRALCDREKLRHLRSEAAARVVEYASRLAEDQDKLTTHLAQVADVLREADFYAAQENAPHITATHIQTAIDERVHRSDLWQQDLSDEILTGTLLIQTSDEAVGQVNGLTVRSLGDYQFGFPTRITASIGMGRDGVLDIEHEVKFSGPVHDKGKLIMDGYLYNRFAQDKPLTLSASLVFEQSYHEVEGDSASCAGLYALLSVLAGLPLAQSLAVTGSMDQHGQVEAIGGVNQKIEGFFDVCQARGLTGGQGVIIPASNVRHLMLRADVVEAVRQGQFRVYAVDDVDQGIELLTGVPAGVRGPDGQFPVGSVNARVDARLRQLAEDLHRFGDHDDKDPDPEDSGSSEE